MRITVRFFASLRDSVGASQVTMDLPDGALLHEMVEQLVTDYPALAGHQASWHFAVNQTHVDPDFVLHAGDRVALFPYVAGG